MEKLFKVTKSTASSKGGFVNTLECTSSVKVFGVTKTTVHKRFMKTDDAVEIGTEANIEMNQYSEQPYTSQYEVDGELRTGVSIYLHEKLV